MSFGVVLITMACYGLAVALWWYERSPHYVAGLLSGHVGALSAPLWAWLYGVLYSPSLSFVQLPLGRPVPWALVISSAWIYSLPALVVLFLFRRRWWFPGYISGLVTFGVVLLYHLLVQLLGLRTQTWMYAPGPPASFAQPTALLHAGMGALVSFGLVYALLLSGRYAPISMFVTLLPTTLALSLLIHGLLGAPLWVPLRFGSLALATPPWVISLGILGTAAMLVWAAHIGAWSMSKLGRRSVA